MADIPTRRTRTLLVDRKTESREAEELLRTLLDARVDVVDVTDKEPDSPELPRPALIAREGYFMGIDEIRDYVKKSLEGTFHPLDRPVPYRIP